MYVCTYKCALYLGASDHGAGVEPQVEYRFTMVDQGVHH